MSDRIGAFSWRSLYRAAMCAAWPFFALRHFCGGRRDTPSKMHGMRRMGLVLPGRLPASQRIWIHALSVGETLSAVPLVQSLKTLSPQTDLVFSNATATGYELARNRLAHLVSLFFVLPHDFPWITELLVSRVNPRMFVLVETDIWPQLLGTLRKRQVPAILVNGRLSDRSFRRFLRVKPFIQSVLRDFHHLFVQSDQDVARFLALGAKPDRVHTAGNLKFDSSIPRLASAQAAGFRCEVLGGEMREVWIAGSTHPGEEDVLLSIHARLCRDLPGLLLILAPRQPRRGTEIAAMASARGFRLARRSAGETAAGKNVFLLDTLGELRQFYAMADIAFIGGSLVPFGGHNPLEAAAAGKPAVWGPHMSNFRDMEEMLLEAGCAGKVDSSEQLFHTLRRWFKDPVMRACMGDRARGLMERNRGCSTKIARALLEYVHDPAPPRLDFYNPRPPEG